MFGDTPAVRRLLLVAAVVLVLVLVVDIDTIRVRPTLTRTSQLHARLSADEGADAGAQAGAEATQQALPVLPGEEPLRWQFTTQTEFIERCSEFDAGGIPADHPSKLAPLFAHPADKPIPLDALRKELANAIEGTQAIKRRAVLAAPISCLVDPPRVPPPPPRRPRIAIVVVRVEKKNDTFAPPDIYARSLLDKQEYAAKHGYDLLVFGNETWQHPRPLYQAYTKWLGTMSVLRQYDWVWMVSGDLGNVLHEQ
ncbi:hypothetical protein ABPG75_009828 [Micractinium tetrahymenae]